MRIKKISVHGFKSFMDRLEIPLPPGMCAIVGPNGCGKSNVVDAIRWAMGEQSAKQLRGRQMEDVIFNGADDHKPLGMAEVSLIFENGNGSFPREFAHNTEISITRRLYRSGESEYLINNVPCRLKDIQEIFMDTGLGNRAYSIIGQGRIGAIIDQKPEETRAMLEEAAGITKYKKKVDESERKIQLTKENLTRVEDILGEVQRQMRSLKYQASKARRFKSISQEIKRLSLVLNANTYHELTLESGSRKQSIDHLVEEEMARSTEFSGIQARIETMNLELEDKDNEISRLREAYLSVKEKVNKKESVLESMAGEKRIQVELENRLNKEKDDLGRRLGELQQEKGTIKEKIGSLKQAALDLEDEISIIDTRVKNRHEHLKKIKQEYEDARSSLNSGMSREMSLTQESGYLSKRIGEITDSRSRLEKEQDEVRLKIEDISAASQRKTQVREALARKLAEIDEDIAGANEKNDALERKKKSVESALKFAEADLNIFDSRLSGLISLTENFEGYKLGVRSIMKATDLDARREGRVLGLVADVIQVDPKLEQAVEAVMADKLQYIIVERQQDGKDAVNYLKERAKGRSSFIPLKDLKDNGQSDNGNGLPLLRDLVTVPDTYRTLINHLLENTALVEDLDRAVALWAGNGKDRSLVTPEGDVVDKSGVISGGKLAHSSHGLLARRREINELQTNVVEGKRKVAELQAELEQVDDEIEEKKTSLKVLTEEKWRCQDEINDLDKIIFRFSHELDQLEKLMERISGDLQQKDKEQNRHTEALSKIESELALCKEKRQRAEAFVREKEFELKESEEEFEQFRDEQAQLKMDFGLSKEEERGLVREVERIDDFALEAEQTFKRIEEDLAGAKQRYQATIEKEEGLREELAGLYEKLRAAEEVVNRADQDRNQFVNDIRQIENQGEALREEIDALKEKIHMAKMEQSEINFKVNSLVDAVREKYDLDLNEIHGSYLEEDFTASEVKAKLDEQKQLKERLGEVNLTAIQEHDALKERFTFITEQRDDLLKSIDALTQAIHKINKTSKQKFLETLEAVDKKLQEVFPILFSGGRARLRLIDETKPLESGVLVEVQPPGKKLIHMGLLSGGEKALVAMALLFAIYLIKPSPFCLLDEVDAPLDEANVDRFNDLLKKIKANSQVILVTHNRRSMEIVDRLFGITMEKQGVSKLVTVDLQGFERN